MNNKALLILVIMGFTLISSGLSAKENNIKAINNIKLKQINLIIQLHFPDKSYVLSSVDEQLDEQISLLNTEDFSKLKSKTFSIKLPKNLHMYPRPNTPKFIIPAVEICNIKTLFTSLISAATLSDKGHRDLPLSPELSVAITHLANSNITLKPSASINQDLTYEIDSETFLNTIILLIKNLSPELEKVSNGHCALSSTSSQEQTVNYFLNQQSCYIFGQCQEPSLKERQQMHFEFIDLDEVALAQLLLGLNFDICIHNYSLKELTGLWLSYFKKASNEDTANQLLDRLTNYIKRSNEDPYELREQLKFLVANLEPVKQAPVKIKIKPKISLKQSIHQQLSTFDTEFDLKPVFTEDIADMSEKVDRTKYLLQQLIETKDPYFPYSTRFEVDVLRTEDDFPVDHRLIDYQLFYQLFKRALLEQKDDDAVYYDSVYTGGLLKFLSENYQDKFVQSLILDMKKSSKFNTALESEFSFYWKMQNQDLEVYWTFMLKVEESYQHSDPSIIAANVKQRTQELRQKRKDKAIVKEQGTMRWWQEQYTNKKRSHEQFYEAMSQNLLDSLYPTEHAFVVADVYTKLLIVNLKSNDFEAGKKIIAHYINHILPIAGASEKTTDISSMGLVLSILSKDEALSQMIFNKLLGEDFKINEISNEILLFNLACYYAINKQKEPMLLAIRQALHHGKQSQQFLDERDFQAYWQDKQFQAVLNGE